MTTIQRMVVLFVCGIFTACAASPSAAKPTREEIVALAEKCKIERKRMDLVGTFGVDFSDLDLSEVDFRGGHATGLETNLRDADLSNCNLQGAKFLSAILDRADLTGANLEGATFVTASLKQATLIEVNFKGTRVYQTDVSGAKLIGADFSAADITGSDFSGADLTDAVLSGAKSDYWWMDFRSADLTRANLSGLNLNCARFQSAVLRSANLSGAQLIQADFTSADLTETLFKDANVESAVFRNAQGLSDAQRDQLEGQAQRWKFDIKTSVAEMLRWMYFPEYILIVVVLVVLSFPALRTPDRPRAVVVAAVVNVLTLLPACVLFRMIILGFSPTMQFNVYDPAAMKLWSAWVGMFGFLVLLLFACLITAVGAALVFLQSHWRWSVLKRTKLALVYLALTVVHCLWVTHWVGSNAPTA